MRRFGIVLSAFLGAFGRSGGAVGALFGVLGTLGGRSWDDLGRFWVALGPVLGHSGRP